MPIHFQGRIRPGNAHLHGYATAQAIARLTTQHFGQWRNAIQPAGGGGLGVGSCCAAFTVNPNADYPAVFPHPFALVLGNSQLAAQGMIWHQGWNVGGHAERAALNVANHEGCVPWLGPHGAVLYVELEPCQHCAQWLQGQHNPYRAFFLAHDLLVWWGWNYPAQVQNMVNFHGLPLPMQNVVVANW